ncbi:MAG: sigma-70 family RNA polymerase sigma factor [Thermoguttaceae bacterium]|nr:sigma-70 family RNA polymerase sigma factor [Thermoguttaceae bacterium]MDW8037981.1 sigma-70 family RNA polymerase sigma factor [Thermoguttaceae bacterium]
MTMNTLWLLKPTPSQEELPVAVSAVGVCAPQNPDAQNPSAEAQKVWEEKAPDRADGLEKSLAGESLSEQNSVRSRTAAESEADPWITLEDLSRQLNVSTKTLCRWRRYGLIGSRVVLEGRPRMAYRRSMVERFIEQNRERVQRASQFSQLSSEEKESIIARARQMAQQGQSLGEIVRQLAAATGRSPETIRLLMKRSADRYPEFRTFYGGAEPVGKSVKREIFERYCRGESVEALAKAYGCSRTTVYRAITQMRLERIMELPLEYVGGQEFERIRTEAQEQEILGPTPPAESTVRKMRCPPDIPPYLASLYETPLLTRQQERHLFRKMNYLKYKAAKLREQLDPRHPDPALMDQIEQYYEQAVAVKNEIIRANLRLVVSIAKRRLRGAGDFFDLVSDGNMSLIRAVEKFDYTRGYKFSTYATWAIVKNFARSIPNELRHQERFRTSAEEVFLTTPDQRSNPYEQQSLRDLCQSQIARIFDRLDEREQQVIRARFGLGPDQQPRTLREVGQLLGVTKERVRQLETRAIHKLRQAAKEERLEFFGIN